MHTQAAPWAYGAKVGRCIDVNTTSILRHVPAGRRLIRVYTILRFSCILPCETKGCFNLRLTSVILFRCPNQCPLPEWTSFFTYFIVLGCSLNDRPYVYGETVSPADYHRSNVERCIDLYCICIFTAAPSPWFEPPQQIFIIDLTTCT